MTSTYVLSFWWLMVLAAIISAAISTAVSYVFASSRMRELERPNLVERPKRRRKRYIVFEVLTALEPSRDEVESSILDSYRRLYGDVGLARSGLKLVEYDATARRGILRVWSTSLDEALASLGYVRRVGNAEAILVPLAVSGTIRGARSKAYRPYERRN